MSFVLAIDQRTTFSSATVFRDDLSIAATARHAFAQHRPQPGWLEHEPDDIWSSTIAACRDALAQAGLTGRDLAAIGISNQRETTLVWDRASGRVVHRAIVWMDHRTEKLCSDLTAQGYGPIVTQRTGLPIEPFFSGTKIAWILDQVPDARARAGRGELLFGTVDCYLLWRLTGGKVHATDATNASRTLLFNIHTGTWDDDLLDLLRVPRAMLPEIKDSSDQFGVSLAEYFDGAVPICGMAGLQQAATIGQACFTPGMVKATYGDGCIAVFNIGKQPVLSSAGFFTTVAYRLDGQCTFAFEGAIPATSGALQWLRDTFAIAKEPGDAERLAAQVDDAQDGYFVPAFSGLGAAATKMRGALVGLHRNSGPADLVHAALESIGYQTSDLVKAMREDCPAAENIVIRVDGDTGSDWTMQRLADLVGAPVERPTIAEPAPLGAAYLAGLAAGIYPEPKTFAANWRHEHRFTPKMSAGIRERKLAGWARAVRGAIEAG